MRRIGSLEGWIAVFVAFVCLSVIALEVAHERSERATEVADDETAVVNLARSLARQAEDTIEIANAAMTGIVERMGAGPGQGQTLPAVQALIFRQVAELARVQGLFVFDGDGRWLAGSVPANAPGIDLDPEYVRFHHADRSPNVHVAVPQRDGSGGQWLMTLSRRVDKSDGSLAAIVLATIDLDYFEGIYGALDIGRSGSIALMRRDGIVLTRFPYDPAFIGRDLSGSTLFRETIPSRRTGSYRMVSPLDGVARIAGYHLDDRAPVGVVVAVSEDEALANWRRSATVRMAVTVGLAATIAILGAFFIRALARRRRERAALVDSEMNFRLLAENSSDVVTRVAQDGTRLYVSPAAGTVLGRSPEELVGTSILEAVDAEDAKAFGDAVARLQAGEAEFATLSYRRRRPDGQSVWLESTIRMAHHPRTGAPDGAVVVSRDVTHRKVLEAELANLARTDALTGLFNRRHFDERLRFEWLRAGQTGQPLSLVLFDLDRFKDYNDTHGHQGGDECLLRVAAEMRARATRPLDVAARYGGEELALLLPSTDLDGALILAERIRECVARLGLPHRRNQPAGIVTVSAGAASLRFDRGQAASPEELVGDADRALYAAKRSGRNRVLTGRRPNNLAGKKCVA